MNGTVAPSFLSSRTASAPAMGMPASFVWNQDSKEGAFTRSDFGDADYSPVDGAQGTLAGVAPRAPRLGPSPADGLAPVPRQPRAHRRGQGRARAAAQAAVVVRGRGGRR